MFIGKRIRKWIEDAEDTPNIAKPAYDRERYLIHGEISRPV
jgi:hypothetical protein